MENNKQIKILKNVILVILFIASIIILNLFVFTRRKHIKRYNEKHSTKKVDSLDRNIKAIDSIVINIKRKQNEEKENIITLTDSATIDLFFKLIDSTETK